MNERDIFQGALDYPDQAQRQFYLDQTCGNNAALRARIEALLFSHESASQFLQVPAIEQLQPASVGRPLQTADFSSGLSGNAEEDGLNHDNFEIESPAAPDLSFLTPSSQPGSLGTLGHYEILQLLGQGAFGLVFKAFDEKLHRHVAIKVMNPALAATSPPRKRFLREARSAAAIRHENIVQVYSVEEQPLPYLVMEYINGQTLKDKLDNSGPLEPAEILHLGRQMANGLAAAHAQGLIHRDIKPGNILIEAGAEQKVKITDFGLARAADDATMTRTGVISGTPMYMAPEQAQGLALDQRTDLFSLGSVLYQMACGRPPFRGPSAIAVLKRVADEAPRPIQEIHSGVSDWLCTIIAKLHAKKPENRFQSAKEVADLLARCQASLQQHSRVDLPDDLKPESPVAEVVPQKPVAVPKELFPRRQRWAVAAAVLVALCIGLSLTEASGVTNFRGTVIRLLSPEGTLVVEVDDPGVSVQIDGEELVITGTGAKEIRLKPGQYKVLSSKDGKLVRQELVTVTRNGRQVVRVSREEVNQTKLQSIEKIDRRPQFRMGGEWRVEGNELVQTSPNYAAILFGDRNWTDYDFEVEFNSQGRTKDGHGAGVLYRATDLANLYDFQIGGWGATVSEVTFLKNQKWGRVPGTFLKVPHEHHRWYKAKVEVRGAKVRCSLDGKDLFVFEDADLPQGMVGLSNGNSAVRWRNLKVTAADGRVLWEGFPEFGLAALSTDSDRKAAEWVLSLGGQVWLDDAKVQIVHPADLPKTPFRLTGIFLRNPKVQDADLHQLKDCQHLARIDLSFTGVSDAGLELLPRTRALTTLGLINTKVTDAGLVGSRPATS